jgi:hypothetical protein
MHLFFIWLIFVACIGTSEDSGLLYYLFFNLLMLIFVYLYNCLIEPLQLHFKLVILLTIIPNSIIGYVIFVFYTNFNI